VTTGVSAIEALTSGEALIFDANGVQQPRLVKGLNIIRTKDGKTRKVMVK
jgi:fructose-1,6-bisphosphatase/sedoheptulose 1,7-bisphosphatase-like protein